MGRILLSPPDMDGRERELLLAAFDSNWIAPAGPDLEAYEREFAARVGAPAGVGVSSGSAGLHLALAEVGARAGTEVIVPSVTFAASANAVVYTGATPVFVDAETRTGNLDVDLLAEELERRARSGSLPAVVLSVDLYGQCCDYTRLEPLCAEYSIPLVVDAAESLGATHAGRPAGTFGMVTVFSTNGNKIITTSGGGMVVSDDETLLARIRYLATQAREPVAHYEHTEIGYNYRLSNLLAAIGRGQLERLDAKMEHRRAVRQRYLEFTDTVPGLTMLEWDPAGVPNGWLSVMQLDAAVAGVTVADVIAHLDSRDIEARNSWKPMHQQPVFKDNEMVGGAAADQLFERGLCVPSGSSLTHHDQDRVIGALAEILRAT